MRAIMFFLIIASVFVHAQEAKRAYKIGGKTLSFKKEGKLYVSQNCSSSSCLALSRFDKMQKGSLSRSSPSKFDKSLAAVACEKMKGKSVFGVDQDQNMMAFCLFEDSSMIEYHSMQALLEQNSK